jgi:hypothetical protein
MAMITTRNIAAKPKRLDILKARREARAQAPAGGQWESLSRQHVDDGKPKALAVAEEAPVKIGPAIFFRGCYGFGDNLNQRPVIKDLADKYDTVYLKTPIPEFYWDLGNVKFVYPDDVDAGTGHRTPSKHLARVPKSMFVPKPDGIPEQIGMRRHVRVGPRFFFEEQGRSTEVPAPAESVSVFEGIRRGAGIPKERYSFMLPVKREWIAAARKVVAGLALKGKKLCLVRPPTIRKEWACSSRNPKAEYIQLLIDRYKDEYFFLSIADIDGKDETLDGRLVGLDAEFHKGELPMTTILGLLKIADMTITGPGMMLQAAVAVRAKAFAVFGGHAGPDYVLDPGMGLDNLEWVAPSPFCSCFLMDHDCNKEIPEAEILAKFEAFRARPKKLKEATVGFPPGIGDALWPAYIFDSFKEKNGIDRLIATFREDWGYTSTFLRNLECIDEVRLIQNRLPFSFFLAGGHGHPLYINKGGLDYMMEYGSQLELGVPLEKVIPGYEVDWNLPIGGLDEYEAHVDALRKQAGGKLTVIYTASKGGNHNWARSDWTTESWMDLIRRFHAENGCKVVMVGMEFDKSYTDELKRLDTDNLIIDLTGKTPIMHTLAILRRANLYVGFSSGLGMLACHFHTPTAIFWPIRGVSEHGIYDKCFMYSWLPPWCRNSDTYAGIPYGPESRPGLVFDRVKKFLNA